MILSPSERTSRAFLRTIIAQEGLSKTGKDYSVEEARHLLNEKETRLAQKEFDDALLTKEREIIAEIVSQDPAEIEGHTVTRSDFITDDEIDRQILDLENFLASHSLP